MSHLVVRSLGSSLRQSRLSNNSMKSSKVLYLSLWDKYQARRSLISGKTRRFGSEFWRLIASWSRRLRFSSTPCIMLVPQLFIIFVDLRIPLIVSGLY